jgi:UDP-hydrolysing UDP-N-acetyl-D-glucosamine 2-epimerase
MTIPRNIALVTTARSDWGIQRPVAAALAARSDVALHIVAGGMHLRREFGHTLDDIIRDGFRVAHRLDYLAAGDGPDSIGKSIGDGVSAFSALFARWQPDLITVLGDRFEMIPAALAATPFAIPIAHLHGGEITRGAFDDQLRHALTKLAHLHLVATEDSARRVRQMGEDPARIHVVGAPGLDDVVNREPVDAGELRKRYGFEPGATNLLVVYHPETRSAQSPRTRWQRSWPPSPVSMPAWSSCGPTRIRGTGRSTRPSTPLRVTALRCGPRPAFRDAIFSP